MPKPTARQKFGSLSVSMALAAALLAIGPAPLRGATNAVSQVEASEALKRLLEGNQRFFDGKSEHPNQSLARREQVASGQHPFACILSCSDSRIPPELVFDQGVGDLFVVRVAGNVPDPSGMESLRYGVDHLGARLIVVLGHRNCGAVKAAVSGQTAEFPVIDQAILPAVEKAKRMPGDLMENVTVENIRLGVQRLKRWGPLAARVKRGEIQIVGAIYDLHTGHVTVLSDQPGASLPPEQGAQD